MLRSLELLEGVPQWARSRCHVVGDLFVAAVGSSPSSVTLQSQAHEGNAVPVVGLLPGSKVTPCTLICIVYNSVFNKIRML